MYSDKVQTSTDLATARYLTFRAAPRALRYYDSID